MKIQIINTKTGCGRSKEVMGQKRAVMVKEKK
jgi:hypothetical protein